MKSALLLLVALALVLATPSIRVSSLPQGKGGKVLKVAEIVDPPAPHMPVSSST